MRPTLFGSFLRRQWKVPFYILLTLPLILLLLVAVGLVGFLSLQLSFQGGRQYAGSMDLECVGWSAIAPSNPLQIGLVAVIALGIAFILNALIAARVTEQLRKLSQVAIAISQGNLNQPIPQLQWVPELGQIAQALRQMVHVHQTNLQDPSQEVETLLREEYKRVEELREMREYRLQLQQLAMIELSKSRLFYSDELEDAFKKITQVAAHILDVERVSIWFYDPEQTKICCTDLYELSQNHHSFGIELSVKDYPSYFRALEADRIITADDAHADLRTQEFSASYLRPLGITSMLDVPLRSGGGTVGVLCLEQVGLPRQWLLEEQNFAAHLAHLVTLALETRDRKIAEAALYKRERYLEALVEVQRRLLMATNEAEIFSSVLEPLGVTAGASRVYIFTNSRDAAGRLLMNQRAEWCGADIRPEIDNPTLQNLSYDDLFPRWSTILAQGETITGVVATFPASERSILEPQDILALAVFPLRVNNRFFGFIGFDNCVEAQEWDVLEISLLRVAAAAISLALEYKQAEVALRQSEESLRRSEATQQAMIAAIPDLLIRIDHQGSYLEFIEKPLIKVFNPGKPVPGANIYDITPPDHAIERMAFVQRALETKEPQVYEYQFTLEGEIYYEEARIVAINSSEALVIVRDITARKVAETALQEKAEREHALNQVVQAIRNSLHLDTIFATATREIARLLHVENVVIAQYLSERGIWLHLAGYQQNPDLQLVGLEIPDAGNPFAERLKRLQVIRIDDTVTIADPINQTLAEAYPGAWLLVPLAASKMMLWGSLSISTSQRGFIWRNEDEDIVRAVADQLAIAIQQADLFRRLQLELKERQRAETALQQLNRDLEERVQERTAQLKMALSAAKMGTWEWDMTSNTQFWSPENFELMGFRTDEQGRVLDQDGNELSPTPTNELFFKHVHPDDLLPILQAEQQALKQRSSFESECRILRQDGSTRWRYTRGAYVYNSDEEPIKLVGISMDITERKQVEMQLRASLKEKEVLLREIHHRVKNNLQVVSAMLSLQAGAVHDAVTLAVLQDSENRLQAMALIHETLYQSRDLGKLNFSDYIQRLADNILTLNGIQGDRIQLIYHLEPVSLNLETAIPCGLLLNELLTNAIKHAFPNQRRGEICITLQQVPTLFHPDTPSDRSLSSPPPRYILEIADNGVGIPIDLNLEHLKSVGLKITYDLATQLRGTLNLNRNHGTHFQLIFSELQYRKRF
jgi:two-component sensor histidine kinase/GAF domain-containing protein/HAMP domain-containing protein